MKRTLIEVLCGLAVVVTMVSFHQRVSRLSDESEQVLRLRELVEETVANAGSKTEIATSKQEVLDQVSSRLAVLQDQVALVSRGAEDATFLKSQIEKAQQEASLLRAEVRRDVQQTQQLVSKYQAEMRRSAELAKDSIANTEIRLEQLSGAVIPDHARLTAELLAPTVQLNGDDTVGSGTLIRSDRDPDSGEVHNYVITSYHVIRNIFSDSPRAKTEGVDVTIYEGQERIHVMAEMVAFDSSIDAALLELKTDRIFAHVANVMPVTAIDEIRVWDTVYALGCPLGNDPIPTTGELSSKENILSGTNYWMINAPTYYGNSGGGVYSANGNRLIGVFSKIYTHGKGNPIVVPHMGLCTPITAIYEWLERDGMAKAIPNHAFESSLASSANLAAPR